jgi:hypothetical protein
LLKNLENRLLTRAVQSQERLHDAVFSIAAGLLLLALQWKGSAWTAEFDGYPDEAAQFVSGQLIRQFLISWPVRDPIGWAGQYYLHYPKVGIGHWPPMYHVLEAVWLLIFGSSRVSAMWLQWTLCLAGIAAICNLARTRFALPVACGIALFSIATPVFQHGLEQTMAEPVCFLCGVLFLYALVHLLENPGRVPFAALLLSIVAAILTKGTGACLIPAPFLAWFAIGKHFTMPSKRVIAVALAVAVPSLLACLWMGGSVRYWGLTFQSPWPIASMGRMAGWGFIVLACLGVRRKPLPVAAACTIASAVVFSFFVRAMNEPRHWIIILPAILLLAGEAITSSPRWAVPVLAVALFLFPWEAYRQVPAGYVDLLRQLPLPARILVSSPDAEGEGACVAEVNLLDKRVVSFVLRGSKVLSQSGWDGENYRLLVTNAKEVETRLDQLAVNEVILDTPGSATPPHHVLLKEAIEGSGNWRLCGRTVHLEAFCRTNKPLTARVPLELAIGGRKFVEKIP